MILTRALGVLLLAVSTQTTPEPGFTSLFNGKDFTGWKIGGPAETFTIQDGAIVANGTASHVYYDGPFRNHAFRNFELKVDVMTRAGLERRHLRAHRAPGPRNWSLASREGFRDPGEQLAHRIRSGPAASITSQDVMDDSPAKDDVWFTEHIIVQGQHHHGECGRQAGRVTGRSRLTGTAAARAQAAAIAGPGTIAFQGHDPNSVGLLQEHPHQAAGLKEDHFRRTAATNSP